MNGEEGIGGEGVRRRRSGEREGSRVNIKWEGVTLKEHAAGWVVASQVCAGEGGGT